ncbi:hypothetical protein D1157_19645 [Anaerotruncus sp. X29]|nr:hypothetical protein [Anaerotruncus sp. X29]
MLHSQKFLLLLANPSFFSSFLLFSFGFLLPKGFMRCAGAHVRDRYLFIAYQYQLRLVFARALELDDIIPLFFFLDD